MRRGGAGVRPGGAAAKDDPSSSISSSSTGSAAAGVLLYNPRSAALLPLRVWQSRLFPAAPRSEQNDASASFVRLAPAALLEDDDGDAAAAAAAAAAASVNGGNAAAAVERLRVLVQQSPITEWNHGGAGDVARPETTFPLVMDKLTAQSWLRKLRGVGERLALRKAIPRTGRGATMVNTLVDAAPPHLRAVWFIKAHVLNDRQKTSADEQDILAEVTNTLVKEAVAALVPSASSGPPSAEAVQARMARLKYLVTLVAWMAADGMMPVGAFVRHCFDNKVWEPSQAPGQSRSAQAAFGRSACEVMQHVMMPILLTNLPAICASRDLARDTFRFLRMRLKNVAEYAAVVRRRPRSPTAPVPAAAAAADAAADGSAPAPNDSEAALVDNLHSMILSLCASIETTVPDALVGIDETRPQILRRSFRLHASVATRTAAVMQLGSALDAFVQSGDADPTMVVLAAFDNWASAVATSLVDRWTRPLAADHPVVAFVCLWGIGHLSTLPLTRFSATATILRMWFDLKELPPSVAQRALVSFIDLIESAEDTRQATRLFTVLTKRAVFSFPVYVRYTIQTGFDRPVAALDDERPSRARKHGFLLSHLPTLTSSDERLRHVVLRDQVPLELPSFGALDVASLESEEALLGALDARFAAGAYDAAVDALWAIGAHHSFLGEAVVLTVMPALLHEIAAQGQLKRLDELLVAMQSRPHDAPDVRFSRDDYVQLYAAAVCKRFRSESVRPIGNEPHKNDDGFAFGNISDTKGVISELTNAKLGSIGARMSGASLPHVSEVGEVIINIAACSKLILMLLRTTVIAEHDVARFLRDLRFVFPRHRVDQVLLHVVRTQLADDDAAAMGARIGRVMISAVAFSALAMPDIVRLVLLPLLKDANGVHLALHIVRSLVQDAEAVLTSPILRFTYHNVHCRPHVAVGAQQNSDAHDDIFRLLQAVHAAGDEQIFQCVASPGAFPYDVLVKAPVDPLDGLDAKNVGDGRLGTFLGLTQSLVRGTYIANESAVCADDGEDGLRAAATPFLDSVTYDASLPTVLALRSLLDQLRPARGVADPKPPMTLAEMVFSRLISGSADVAALGRIAIGINELGKPLLNLAGEHLAKRDGLRREQEDAISTIVVRLALVPVNRAAVASFVTAVAGALRDVVRHPGNVYKRRGGLAAFHAYVIRRLLILMAMMDPLRTGHDKKIVSCLPAWKEAVGVVASMLTCRLLTGSAAVLDVIIDVLHVSWNLRSSPSPRLGAASQRRRSAGGAVGMFFANTFGEILGEALEQPVPNAVLRRVQQIVPGQVLNRRVGTRLSLAERLIVPDAAFDRGVTMAQVRERYPAKSKPWDVLEDWPAAPLHDFIATFEGIERSEHVPTGAPV